MLAEADLCIVGGGPAGMMAGLLFARAGVRTIVLEKHQDFFRDFRGDTIHPSTLRLFSELGLLDRLLERPHDKVSSVGAWIEGRELQFADFSRFDPRWNFIAMTPQWHFLDFIADVARGYPHFSLLMGVEATALLEQGGRVTGVSVVHEGQADHIAAKLVIASDGRRSVLREDAGLPLVSLGSPMDVFWFRLPKQRAAANQTAGIFGAGRLMVLIDRGEYWQCAYVFAKGEADTIRQRGLEAFRRDIAQLAPMVAGAVDALASWDDVKLLSVALDRLQRWHKPGLLVIGDAAHAMSPIGGVGINVAVQDAVAAANILAGPMAQGRSPDPLLAKVQSRRMLPVKLTQSFQAAVQKRVIGRLLEEKGEVKAPGPLKLLNRFPLLRRIPAAFLAFGVRAEHIRSPAQAPCADA